jgi:hypothetical protein
MAELGLRMRGVAFIRNHPSVICYTGQMGRMPPPGVGERTLRRY